MRRHLASLCRRLAVLLESPSHRDILQSGSQSNWLDGGIFDDEIRTFADASLTADESPCFLNCPDPVQVDGLCPESLPSGAGEDDADLSASRPWFYCI